MSLGVACKLASISRITLSSRSFFFSFNLFSNRRSCFSVQKFCIWPWFKKWKRCVSTKYFGNPTRAHGNAHKKYWNITQKFKSMRESWRKLMIANNFIQTSFLYNWKHPWSVLFVCFVHKIFDIPKRKLMWQHACPQEVPKKKNALTHMT